MSAAPRAAPRRLERGVYCRITIEGKTEYGSRCDDLDGVTRWRWGFPSLVKARQDYHARRAVVRRDRETAGETTPTRATLAELVQAHLPTILNKRASYAQIRTRLEWWADRFKARPVLTLKAVDIERGMAALMASGLTGATANRYAAQLRHLMRKHVSPLAWVEELWRRIEWYDEPQPSLTPLTDQQEDRLYAALDFTDALYTRLDILIGLRLRQFFTLRWDWLDWAPGLLHLPSFKRHPARTLPLSQEALAIFAVLWEEQGRPESGWIFPRRQQTFIGAGRGLWKPGPILIDRSAPLNPHNWYRRRYRPAIERAGLPETVTFHTLRKTWASRVGPHAPARILQILGGWRDSKVVERYCQPYEEAMRSAMEQGARVPTKSVIKVSHGLYHPTGKLAQLIKNKEKRPRSSGG